MSPYLLALPIGVVAGLRTMIAPAAVSWAARRGRLPLQDTPLASLGFTATLAGSKARGWLAGALGRDRPAALLEDAVAVGGAALTVAALA